MHIFPQRIPVISLTKLNSWQEKYPGSQSPILFYYENIWTCFAFLKKCVYPMWMILKWISRQKLMLDTEEKRRIFSLSVTKEMLRLCTGYRAHSTYLYTSLRHSCFTSLHVFQSAHLNHSNIKNQTDLYEVRKIPPIVVTVTWKYFSCKWNN